MGLLRQDPTVRCMQSALLVFPHHLQQIKHSVLVEAQCFAAHSLKFASCTGRVTLLCFLTKSGVHFIFERLSRAQPHPLCLRQAQRSQNSLSRTLDSF